MRLDTPIRLSDQIPHMPQGADDIAQFLRGNMGIARCGAQPGMPGRNLPLIGCRQTIAGQGITRTSVRASSKWLAKLWQSV